MKPGDERAQVNYEVDHPNKEASRSDLVEGLLQQKLLELGLAHKSADSYLRKVDREQPQICLPPIAAAEPEVPQIWELKKAHEPAIVRLSNDLKVFFPQSDFVLHRVVKAKTDASIGWSQSLQLSICRIMAGVIHALLLDGDVLGVEMIAEIATKLLGPDVVANGKRRPLLIKKYLDSEGFDHPTLWSNIKGILSGLLSAPFVPLDCSRSTSASEMIEFVTTVLRVLKVPVAVVSFTSTPTGARLDHSGRTQNTTSPRLLVIVESAFDGEVILGLLPLKLRLVSNLQENSKLDQVVKPPSRTPNIADFTFHDHGSSNEDVDEFLKEYQGEVLLPTIPIPPQHSFRFDLKSEYFVYTSKVEKPEGRTNQTLRSWRLLQFDVIRNLNRFLDRFSEATQNVEIQADLAQSRKILQSKVGLTSERGAHSGATTIIQNPVYIQHSIVQSGTGLFAVGNYPTAPY